MDKITKDILSYNVNFNRKELISYSVSLTGL